MNRSSALEMWIHELLARARRGFSTHDRFVLVTVALSVTPMPFPALLALCLGILQLHLIRTGRLDRRERPLLRIAILLGLLNLAVWLTMAAVLVRSGLARNAIMFLRDAHLYPLFWLGRLLGRRPEPPAWILVCATICPIGLARTVARGAGFSGLDPVRIGRSPAVESRHAPVPGPPGKTEASENGRTEDE